MTRLSVLRYRLAARVGQEIMRSVHEPISGRGQDQRDRDPPSARRIAFYLPSLRGGGAERVMVTLANAFAGRGFPVDLVLAGAVGEYVSEISPDVRLVDLRCSRVMTSLPALVRYLRRERPGVLLSAMSHANVVAVWARAFGGRPVRVVVAQHNTLSQAIRRSSGARAKIVTRLIGPSYARADAVIAVSKGVADDLAREIRLPEEQIEVIFNPVDLPLIRQRAGQDVDHPWLSSVGPPVILSAGRLVPEKDFGTLMRAFKILRSTRAARLVILGEGPLREDLQDLARELGIETDLSMPGFVGNPYAYMARARVFVLSSRTEGLPTALIEAMACGCSVVSTDCPSGPAEILQGGKWGRLVPVGDSDTMAAAIEGTLGQTVRGHAKKRARDFGLDSAIEKYIGVLFPDRRVCSA